MLRSLVTGLIVLAVFSGCASRKKPMNEWAAWEKYQDYVPPSAKSVVEGTGRLSYTAPEDGILYVIDLSRLVVIKEASFPHAMGSWLALRGQTIVFDPATGRIGVAGEEGLRIRDVDPTHKHELRFDPSNKDK